MGNWRSRTPYITDKLEAKKREQKIKARAYQLFQETGNKDCEELWSIAAKEVDLKIAKMNAIVKPTPVVKTTQKDWSDYYE